MSNVVAPFSRPHYVINELDGQMRKHKMQKIVLKQEERLL
jgi:hypothetical protein